MILRPGHFRTEKVQGGSKSRILASFLYILYIFTYVYDPVGVETTTSHPTLASYHILQQKGLAWWLRI